MISDTATSTISFHITWNCQLVINILMYICSYTYCFLTHYIFGSFLKTKQNLHQVHNNHGYDIFQSSPKTWSFESCLFSKEHLFFNRDHTTKDASAGIITACVHFRRKELF